MLYNQGKLFMNVKQNQDNKVWLLFETKVVLRHQFNFISNICFTLIALTNLLFLLNILQTLICNGCKDENNLCFTYPVNEIQFQLSYQVSEEYANY